MESSGRRQLLRINTLKGAYKGVWEEMRMAPPLPPRRYFHSACISDFNLLIYGGQDISEGAFSDLWILHLSPSDPSQERWECVIASGESPGTLCRHSALVYQRNMFIFGGNDGSTESTTVYSLDLSTYIWRMVCLGSPGLDSHSSVLHGTKVYSFGGYLGGLLSNEVYIFDLESFTWSLAEIAVRPEPRAEHRCVVHGSNMFMYGGKGTDSALSDCWMLDLNSLVWSEVRATGDTPGHVSGHSLCLYGDVVLLFGGIRDILKETNEMYTYDFANNSWCMIQTQTQVEDPVTPADVDQFNKKKKKKKQDRLVANKNILYNGPPSPMQGRIIGKIPHSRDGHSATLFENYMIIFGGDRYQMAFNDLYCYSVYERHQ